MVNTALEDAGTEILIALKRAQDFDELKTALEKKISMIDDFRLGNEVIIDIGNYQIASKQIRYLEDILLDYGFHLKEIISTGGGSGRREPDTTDDYNENPLSMMPDYENTVMICRHLRSGQKVFVEGNIVILGDINPGAEVIAGGNILVMGSIKGMAHAGAFGDESALIAALRLKPTQLRIASHFTRAPDEELIAIERPEMARIKTGKVVIEKLKI